VHYGTVHGAESADLRISITALAAATAVKYDVHDEYGQLFTYSGVRSSALLMLRLLGSTAARRAIAADYFSDHP